MTYDEFVADIWEMVAKSPRSWRKGQAVFNVIEEKYDVEEEKLYIKNINKVKSKKDLITFNEGDLIKIRDEDNEYLQDDVSIVSSISKNDNLHVRSLLRLTNINFLVTFGDFPQELLKFLDPSIEKGFQTQEKALQFLKEKGSPEITSSINLTIVLKSSDLPIGQLSVMMFGDDVVSFGYWIGKSFWGKGFASEACFLVCDKVFNADDVRFISIYCNSENKSSFKLACKIFNYLENQNKMSFKLKRSETSNNLIFNSREFVMKGLVLQKLDLTDF